MSSILQKASLMAARGFSTPDNFGSPHVSSILQKEQSQKATNIYLTPGREYHMRSGRFSPAPETRAPLLATRRFSTTEPLYWQKGRFSTLGPLYWQQEGFRRQSPFTCNRKVFDARAPLLVRVGYPISFGYYLWCMILPPFGISLLKDPPMNPTRTPQGPHKDPHKDPTWINLLTHGPHKDPTRTPHGLTH